MSNFIGISKLLGDRRTLALVDQVVVSSSNFASMLLAGRFMPQQDFGVFVLAYAVFLFLSNLHRALITQPLNVIGASELPEALADRLATLICLHLFLLPLGGVILVACGASFFPDRAIWIAAICYLSTFSIQDLFRRYCYTSGKLKTAVGNDLVSYLGQVTVLAILGASELLSATSAFYTLAATSALACLLALPTLLKGQTSLSRARQVITEHWRFGGWLIATVLATWGASQLYPFLIASLGAAAVASFAACRNLLNGIGILVQTANNILPTRMRKIADQQGPMALHQITLKSAILFGGVALSFCSGAAIWSAEILHFVYGGAYADAAPIMRILSVGTFFTVIGAVVGSLALATGNTRSSFIANLVSAGFTFSFGLIAIEKWQITGAAWAASGSLLIAVATQSFLVYRARAK